MRVGRAYEVSDITSSENPLAMVGAVASTLTQNKPFIVLDGKIDERVAGQFIDKCADNLPVLILNEEELEGDWASIEIDTLNEQDAATLFKQKAGIATHDSEH